MGNQNSQVEKSEYEEPPNSGHIPERVTTFSRSDNEDHKGGSQQDFALFSSQLPTSPPPHQRRTRPPVPKFAIASSSPNVNVKPRAVTSSPPPILPRPAQVKSIKKDIAGESSVSANTSPIAGEGGDREPLIPQPAMNLDPSQSSMLVDTSIDYDDVGDSSMVSMQSEQGGGDGLDPVAAKVLRKKARQAKRERKAAKREAKQASLKRAMLEYQLAGTSDQTDGNSIAGTSVASLPPSSSLAANQSVISLPTSTSLATDQKGADTKLDPFPTQSNDQSRTLANNAQANSKAFDWNGRVGVSALSSPLKRKLDNPGERQLKKRKHQSGDSGTDINDSLQTDEPSNQEGNLAANIIGTNRFGDFAQNLYAQRSSGPSNIPYNAIFPGKSIKSEAQDESPSVARQSRRSPIASQENIKPELVAANREQSPQDMDVDEEPLQEAEDQDSLHRDSESASNINGANTEADNSGSEYAPRQVLFKDKDEENDEDVSMADDNVEDVEEVEANDNDSSMADNVGNVEEVVEEAEANDDSSMADDDVEDIEGALQRPQAKDELEGQLGSDDLGTVRDIQMQNGIGDRDDADIYEPPDSPPMSPSETAPSTSRRITRQYGSGRKRVPKPSYFDRDKQDNAESPAAQPSAAAVTPLVSSRGRPSNTAKKSMVIVNSPEAGPSTAPVKSEGKTRQPKMSSLLGGGSNASTKFASKRAKIKDPRPGQEQTGPFSQHDIRNIEKAMEKWRDEHNLTQEEVNDIIHKNPQRAGTGEFWDHMHEACPKRKRQKLIDHIRRIYHNFEARGTWTDEQHKELVRAYEMHGNKYRKIADQINRHPEDVRDRVRNYVVCGENRRKDAWSEEEERKFIGIMEMTINQIEQERAAGKPGFQRRSNESLIDWQVVSQGMDRTRSRLQCRSKWKLVKAAMEGPQMDSQAGDSIDDIIQQAREEASSIDHRDRSRIVKAIRDSGAVRDSRIPWRKCRDMLKGQWSRATLMVLWYRLRATLEAGSSDHKTTISEIATELRAIYKRTKELNYLPEDELDLKAEYRTVSHALNTVLKRRKSASRIIDSSDSEEQSGSEDAISIKPEREPINLRSSLGGYSVDLGLGRKTPIPPDREIEESIQGSPKNDMSSSSKAKGKGKGSSNAKLSKTKIEEDVEYVDSEAEEDIASEVGEDVDRKVKDLDSEVETPPRSSKSKKQQLGGRSNAPSNTKGKGKETPKTKVPKTKVGEDVEDFDSEFEDAASEVDVLPKSSKSTKRQPGAKSGRSSKTKTATPASSCLSSKKNNQQGMDSQEFIDSSECEASSDTHAEDAEDIPARI